MPSGHVLALYLFEVGDAVDVRAVGTLVGSSVAGAADDRSLRPRPTCNTSSRRWSSTAPRSGSMPPAPASHGSPVYDYGIIAVRFTEPLPSSWEDLIELGQRWQDNPRILAEAERCCRELVRRIGSAITALRSSFLWEDYVIFALTPSGDGAADALLEARGAAIAQLLRGEREPLSAQERDEVLRHRISYYASDLVIATWSSALVYDSEAGARELDRDARVRELAAPAVPLLRPAARRRAGTHLCPAAEGRVAANGLAAATPGQPATSTRSSSMSTS